MKSDQKFIKINLMIGNLPKQEQHSIDNTPFYMYNMAYK